jgi:hypothetical protein
MSNNQDPQDPIIDGNQQLGDGEDDRQPVHDPPPPPPPPAPIILAAGNEGHQKDVQVDQEEPPKAPVPVAAIAQPAIPEQGIVQIQMARQHSNLLGQHRQELITQMENFGGRPGDDAYAFLAAFKRHTRFL